MKKKILSLILAIAMVLPLVPVFELPVFALEATSGNYTYTVSNGEATITDVNTSISGKITIPSTLGGYPVTSIGDDAFAHCSSLTSITIPNSVTSIGRSAFYCCRSLTSISIPDSVTSIGNWAFGDCSRLTSVNIGNGVTSIGSYAFYYCRSLTSISIPDSVTSIGEDAFYSCSSLTSVNIGNGVTSIGSSAFSGCSGLTSITVAEGNSVYHSSGNCLIETSSKTLVLGCKNSVIPTDGSVTSIGSNAFYYSSLTSITIPDSVTSIGDDAFAYCSSLTSVTIPDSVTSIGDDAFYNTAYYNKASNWEGNVLYIGNHLIDAKASISNSYAIKKGTKTIADYAFRGCSSLTSVTIPDSVTSIGGYAFNGCSSLTSITIPDSVTSIGDYAFAYCTSLTSVTIDGVKSIGAGAFEGCSNLTSITIPDSVTSIGDWAFRDCTSLTEITLPFVGAKKDGTSDTHFGYIFGASSYSNHASYVPASLKTVVITGGSSIGDYAFYNCDSLTSITIPDSVTSIGDDAFIDCDSLTSITIPDGVTSIGWAAFSWCDSLTSIAIPDSVTSIGDDAFSGCTSLASINIPDSVTSIGDDAFSNCYRLTSITIGNGVTSIGNRAFFSCHNLTSISIGNGVTSIGNEAFGSCGSPTDVWYEGSEADRARIFIGEDNGDLTSATWHYDSCIKNPASEKVHVYDNACDIDCNVCGQTRTPPHDYTIQDKNTTYHWIKCALCGRMNESTRTPHVFDNACDTTCNVCGTERQVPDHVFDNACDTDCNVCGQTRTPSDHVYDSVCDTDCNVCGQTRTPPHDYTIQDKNTTYHWIKCSLCGRVNESTRTPHVYDDACDIDCNVCGQIRTPPHDYTVQDKDETYHWLKCSLCGRVNESTRTAHVFDNACDTTCNVCGTERQVPDHVFDNACDADCNVCGQDRTPPHDYTIQDKNTTYHWIKCALCGRANESTRSSHAYDNACDDSCNGCDFKRIPPHKYDSDADYECNLCLIRRPAAPKSESVVGTTVTLKTVEGCEYSTDGFTWQASPVFEDLDPVTTYTFYQRYAETAVYYASAASLGTKVTTKKATPSAPAAPTAEEITKTSVTLVKEDGMQYSLDGKTWKTSSVFTGLRRGGVYTFYVRYGETSTHYASPASEALEVQTLKDPQLAPKAPTLVKVTGTSVTLFAAEGIEYSKDGENWQSEATFRGLTPDTEYTFYQRQAEKDEYYASPASVALVVKTLSVTPGDVDNDGDVDLDDAIYLLYHVNFKDTYPVNQSVDFNGDGKEDLDDAIYLLYHVNFKDTYPLH